MLFLMCAVFSLSMFYFPAYAADNAGLQLYINKTGFVSGMQGSERCIITLDYAVEKTDVLDTAYSAKVTFTNTAASHTRAMTFSSFFSEPAPGPAYFASITFIFDYPQLNGLPPGKYDVRGELSYDDKHYTFLEEGFFTIYETGIDQIVMPGNIEVGEPCTIQVSANHENPQNYIVLLNGNTEIGKAVISQQSSFDFTPAMSGSSTITAELYRNQTSFDDGGPPLASKDASLAVMPNISSVLAQSPSWSGTGNDAANYKTAVVAVANSISTLTKNDFVLSTGASLKFGLDVNPTGNGDVSLTAGDNTVYAIVTSADSTTKCYYRLAIARSTGSASSSPSAQTFAVVTAGYSPITPQAFTITNTGTGELANLTAALGASSSFEICTSLSPSAIAIGGTASISVKPKDGLSAGTYTDNLTIFGDNGISLTIPLSFTVNAASAPSASGGGGGAAAPTAAIDKNVITVGDTKIDPGKIDTSKEKFAIDIAPGKDAAGTHQPAAAIVPAGVLTMLSGKNDAFLLEIATPYGLYQVPVNLASLIPGFSEMLSKNNLKAEDVSFKITLTDRSNDADILAAIEKGVPQAKMLGAVVDFKIEVMSNMTGMSIGEAASFTKTLDRLIPMPKDLTNMPASYGAWKYNEKARSMAFVPHKKVQIGNVWYALIRSSTNSVYFVAENNITFSDVSDGKWYADAIRQAAGKTLVSGVGGGLYDPERSVTRAEFVQMMANTLSLPSADADTKAYGDVKQASWYYGAIMKAESAGLLVRFAGDSFMPDQPITREEMAAILAQAANYANAVMTAESVDLSAVFTDYGEVSSVYQDDLQAVYKLKIMQGADDGKFDPKGVTTRAQAATVLINMTKVFGMID